MRSSTDLESAERAVQRLRLDTVRARLHGERWATVEHVHAVASVITGLRQFSRTRELTRRLVKRGLVQE